MNITHHRIRRRVALPALGAMALVAGLCLGPIAAIADTLGEETEQVAPVEIESLQLPTLDLDEEPVADIPAAHPDDAALPTTSTADAGSPGPNAEFTASTGRFVGTVLDRDDHPVAGAIVYVYPEGDNQWHSYAFTDAAGYFATGELAPGVYTLAFQKAGFAWSYLGDVHSRAAAQNVTIVAGQDRQVVAHLTLGTSVLGMVRFADGAPAAGYRMIAMFDNGGYTFKVVGADGTAAVADLSPQNLRISVAAPAGNVNPPIGWVTIGSSLLSTTPTVYVLDENGVDLEFEVWLPLLADGTPATPQLPGDTDPGDTEPGDTEPGDTEPGDTEECTDPLTGQPAACEPTTSECTNPLTGQPEACAPEMCIDEATGAHYECNSTPDCEYLCDSSTTDDDTPTSSTVPEYPDTDLTTLAFTGSDWRGVAGAAGALALVGGGLYLVGRWASRDRLMARR